MEKGTAKKHVYFRTEAETMLSKSRPVGRPLNNERVLIEGAMYIVKSGNLELVHMPDTKPVDIKPGGLYQSRDGRKIQIHAINKNSEDKPVVGMILTEGIWEARYWNLKGLVKKPYGVGQDIIAEWNEG